MCTLSTMCILRDATSSICSQDIQHLFSKAWVCVLALHLPCPLCARTCQSRYIFFLVLSSITPIRCACALSFLSSPPFPPLFILPSFFFPRALRTGISRALLGPPSTSTPASANETRDRTDQWPTTCVRYKPVSTGRGGHLDCGAIFGRKPAKRCVKLVLVQPATKQQQHTYSAVLSSGMLLCGRYSAAEERRAGCQRTNGHRPGVVRTPP